jgi:hypothetical protein
MCASDNKIGFSSNPISSRHNSQLFPGSVLFANLKKARPVLLNGHLRKGERLVPPLSLDLVMRASFPADSTVTKVGILNRCDHFCPLGFGGELQMALCCRIEGSSFCFSNCFPDLILVQSSWLALAELVLNWLLRCWFADDHKMVCTAYTVQLLNIWGEQATERFQSIYPVVRELALAGTFRSKATRAVAQQLLPLSLAALSEGCCWPPFLLMISSFWT